MANWIEAVNRYRPRVTNAPTIDIDFLAERLAVGTLITRPLARMVLEELGREVAGLLRTGHKVRLPAKPTGGGGGGGSNGAGGRPRRPTADLAGIYAQVAYDIPCPVERYWGRR